MIPSFSHRSLSRISLLSLTVATLTGSAISMAQDAAPADARTEFMAAMKELRAKVGSDALFRDEAKRTELAPTLIPLIQRTITAAEAMAASSAGGIPEREAVMKRQIHLTYTPMLIALGDDATIKAAAAKVAGTDAPEATMGRATQILGAFLAGPGEAEQLKAVETLGAFFTSAGQNPVADLTGVLLVSKPAASPAVSAALTKALEEAKPGPMSANALKRQEAQASQNSLVDKPLTLSGVTVDGKALSTDEWKGKVILVDFWATWCGPCKAELPHLKQLYKDYHEKGLEIIGISNDYTAKALSDFQAADPELAWPSLFDADAAGKRKWHPLTQKFGINGIPVMYLIDRKGILRSVTARGQLDELIPKLIAEQ